MLTIDAPVMKQEVALSESSKACQLLEKLSAEIRMMIWRECFQRPGAICPNNMSYFKNYSGKYQVPRSLYFEQDIHTMARPHVYAGRQPGFKLTAKGSYVKVKALSGINILRTNKKINAEACQVLYGENEFAFGKAFGNQTIGIHPFDTFRKMFFSSIPGHRSTHRQDVRAMKRLFHLKKPWLRHSEFLDSDPLFIFLQKIGSQNAALLTRVTLEGRFDSTQEDRSADESSIGFLRLLPIYTAAIKVACPSLRSLTLKQEVDKEQDRKLFMATYNNQIDEAIGKVVHELPRLHELHLVCSHYPGLDTETCRPWGYSVRWVKFVRDRHLENKRRHNDGMVEEHRKDSLFSWGFWRAKWTSA